MALETLKGVNVIGGYGILRMEQVKEKHPELFDTEGNMDWERFDKEVKPYYFITIHDDRNIISFSIQNGPIKENGVNGCQVDTIIETAKCILEGFQKGGFSNNYNASAIYHLRQALSNLEDRKKDRENRGVEGYNIK